MDGQIDGMTQHGWMSLSDKVTGLLPACRSVFVSSQECRDLPGDVPGTRDVQTESKELRWFPRLAIRQPRKVGKQAPRALGPEETNAA